MNNTPFIILLRLTKGVFFCYIKRSLSSLKITAGHDTGGDVGDDNIPENLNHKINK